MRRMSMKLMVLTLVASCGDPHVLSGYGSPMGVRGLQRSHAHSGVDFRANDGDPVLAVAAGEVVAFVDAPNGGGKCLLIRHECNECVSSEYYSSYCHLKTVAKIPGRKVLRGEKIGQAGRTGRSGGISHVHLSVCLFPCVGAVHDGDLSQTVDPLSLDVGCFQPNHAYEPGRHVHTHPIECHGK